jgi:transcriptional regulator with XRE-family HTH domain
VEIEEPRSVGGRFKLERIRQGLTLNDLAERIGVTRERIRQLELSGTCTESLIHRYAEALDVSVDYLLHDTVELAEINAQADQVAAIRENRVRNYTYHGGLKERLERLEELVGQG